MESNCIAYLSHEIPGASSTFVYNEMLILEKLGCQVESFSIHRVVDNFQSEKLKKIHQKTEFLYALSLKELFLCNFLSFIKRPVKYSKVLFQCLFDLFKNRSSPMFIAGMLYRFLVAIKLAEMLQNKNVYHLHAHFADIPVDIAMYCSLFSGIPYSFTAHANDLFQRSWLLDEKLKRAKFCATISNFNIDWLRTKKINCDKIHVVRCGVDSHAFERRVVKNKSAPVVFGLVGRLIEKKGISVLIDACYKLCQKRKDFIVEIVGDGPLKEKLDSKVKSLNLSDKVIFKGMLPHGEVSSWLNDIDYFVLPCVKDSMGDMDGIPVALMEAMLKGVPVISTKLSGIPELICHEKTGLLAEAESVESLSDIMDQVIDEPHEALECRVSNAELCVRENYDLHENSEKLLGLIKS